MKIDGREIPVQVLRTQYGQFIEVYETKPDRWVDLGTGIIWVRQPNGSWRTVMGGMSATAEAQQS